MQDQICHEKQKILAQLNYLKQKNQLMYFYPIKVQNQNEVLENKKQELKLYEKIIERTFEFISDRIHENENKQALVKELNQFVGQAIGGLLEEEEQYYSADHRDKLKVPPYNGVRRLPRGEEALKEEAGDDLRMVFKPKKHSADQSKLSNWLILYI